MTDTQDASEQNNQNQQVQPAHQFQKGHSGNPGGRPKQWTAYKMLREALLKVSQEKGETFFENFVRKAYNNEKYALALIQSLTPEFKRVSAKVADNGENLPDKTGGLKIIVIGTQNNQQVNISADEPRPIKPPIEEAL